MLPFIEIGGSGPLIHFSHANGFHPRSYTKLFDLLTPNYSIVASLHRPLWKSNAEIKQVDSWYLLADDLISFLESNVNEKVLGIGHSLGAVITLLAADKRPDLFKSIVLIEPVLMPRLILFLFNLLPLRLKKKIPIIRRSLSRPDTWSSKEEAFQFHRAKRVFQFVNNEILRDYIYFSTGESDGDNVTLLYSKEWESHCYLLLMDVWSHLKSCKVPVMGIRGEHSDVLLASAWLYWKHKNPSHHLYEIPATSHLIPLEKPLLISQLINSWPDYF